MTRPTVSIACLDIAGTLVTDDGAVLAAFDAALDEAGLAAAGPERDRATAIVRATMGQSKIEVFGRILADERAAQQANLAFERHFAAAVAAGQVPPLPGAAETLLALRAAGIAICLATGFAPVTRDAVIDAVGWRPLIDLALSPADAGSGRPWPDLPLTALLRLGGGSVRELLVAGDTVADVESGLRAGAGVVAGVLTGSGSRAELTAAGAHHVLASVTDLTDLLGLGPTRGQQTAG